MKTKSKFRFITLLLLAFYISGCSSWAHRPYACRETRDPLVYRLIGGFIFQVGECAPFENFRIEIGDYYRHDKPMIDFEIKTYDKGKVFTHLENLAKAYNCDKEVTVIFADAIYDSKDKIFGPNFDNSARFVSLAILELINQTPSLSENCKKR